MQINISQGPIWKFKVCRGLPVIIILSSPAGAPSSRRSVFLYPSPNSLAIFDKFQSRLEKFCFFFSFFYLILVLLELDSWIFLWALIYRDGKMSFLMRTLTRKQEVDDIIRDTLDQVLVLRFGRESDPVCLHLDDIVILSSFSSYEIRNN